MPSQRGAAAPEDGVKLSIQPSNAQLVEVELALEQLRGGNVALARDGDVLPRHRIKHKCGVACEAPSVCLHLLKQRNTALHSASRALPAVTGQQGFAELVLGRRQHVHCWCVCACLCEAKSHPPCVLHAAKHGLVQGSRPMRLADHVAGASLTQEWTPACRRGHRQYGIRQSGIIHALQKHPLQAILPRRD